ncbi:FecR family protein [Niabella aurantiaca]|uniref:FecR family protein n=1 Tax=Niabella aurantiaca TaxID=379900 RepID=UPI00036E3471|nr:FecR domain-containing protein [Niabella aurantiaca]
MDQYQTIAAFIVKKLREEIAPAEDERLMEWVNSSPANRSLYEQFMDARQFEDLLKTTYQSRFRIEQQLLQALEAEKRKVRTHNWKRWAVAALLVLSAGAAGYMVFNRSYKPAPSAKRALLTVPAPDRSRATITLSDGRTVYLDSAEAGQLTLQGNIKLIKLANGQLAYQGADGTVQTREIYNTLTNPKGSKVIDMRLSDGTHVWLNAGSSITYPVMFIGGERKIALKGEGYFEVAKDAARRFRVTSNGFSVEVLGTHFNVNTYDDEPASKVTLLEGSVVVKPALEKAAGNEGVRLVPGQQAVLRRSNREQVDVGPADIDQVMAWKNGLFQFRSEDVASIARQLGTWYNVTIVYRGMEEKKVTGYISRTAPLSEVLKMLEIATGIHAENKNGMIVLQ